MRRSCINFNPIAFTFIELLLVMVLLSMMAAIAVPNFSRMYKGLILGQTVDEMVYLMRYAQSRAIAKSRPLRFHVDSRSAQFWLTETVRQSETQQGGESFAAIPGPLGRIYKIPPEIRAEAPISLIGFRPDGRIEKGKITLCLKDDCRIITTEEQTGYVEVLGQP